MTGKEDLFTYEEVSRLAKRLEEETIETRCELTKYKRAFEILKEKTGMEVRPLQEWEKEAYSEKYELISFSNQRFLKDEEYELLEELMKGE